MQLATSYRYSFCICRQSLRTCVCLTVVMGLTWIIGFLVIEVEELLAVAYIFTIFVAFQGLSIFVVLVLLDSKMIRDMLAKWWRARFERSDFYSRHFGRKGLMLGTSSVRFLTIEYVHNNLKKKRWYVCGVYSLHTITALSRSHGEYNNLFKNCRPTYPAHCICILTAMVSHNPWTTIYLPTCLLCT